MSMFDREQLYSSTGQILTKSLFSDFGAEKANILTLNRSDKGFPCLRKLYVDLTVDDPSEYTFVEKVFGDFAFWDKLSKVSWMRENLEEWRVEADVKRKSEAFKCIVNEIKDDKRNAYQAAKYLIEEPWKGKSKAVRTKSKETSQAALPDNVSELREYLERKS